jgi:hypothetical protein
MNPDNNSTDPMTEPDTADDVLEETRQDPMNASVGDKPLNQDDTPPAANADDMPSDDTDAASDLNHPSQDTGVDATETYDQGSPS